MSGSRLPARPSPPCSPPCPPLRGERPPQTLDGDRRQRVGLGVVGEHAAQEEAQVAEPPVERRALVGRHREDELGEPGRVELAEAPVPPAAPALDPDRPARHVRVGGEQVGEEEAPQGVVHQVAQGRRLEDGHAAPRAETLGHERQPLEERRRARQQGREGHERARQHEGVALALPEERVEHLRQGEEALDLARLVAQAGGGTLPPSGPPATCASSSRSRSVRRSRRSSSATMGRLFPTGSKEASWHAQISSRASGSRRSSSWRRSRSA